jgi:hypothetical protein
MNIAIDFDGTIVTHEFPRIGDVNPYAFSWMKKFQEAGARLILWTMRSDGQECGPVLTEAVDHCRANGVEFFGVNSNPEQGSWTTSPKAYAHLYIDDAAFGCPLRENPRAGGRPMVDWELVGPKVLELLMPTTSKENQ